MENEEPDIETEIEDPEAVKLSVEGEEILEIRKGEGEEDFNENLAETLDEGTIQSLAGDLAEDITNDLASRKDWEQRP